MTDSPHLLFVSSRYLFPTDSGGKIRTVNVLRGMKGGAFHITLASPYPPKVASGTPSELSSICDDFVGWSGSARGSLFQWTRLRHVVSDVPVAVATDYSHAGASVVRAALARSPDVVVVDFPHAAVLAPPPYRCASVIFTHNVEAEIFRRHAKVARGPLKRAIWRDQARKMQRYERVLLAAYTTVVAVADRDRVQFERDYELRNVRTIPTGVDLDFFTHSTTPDLDNEAGGTVVFTGSMDWIANVDGVQWFMDEVWPTISRARPRARCVIVGRSPPRSLVERAESRGLPWEFTGFVDDVRPYVRAAHVFVIPLRVGGGTRIKAYEAMALGCPVVSTRIGVEGLAVHKDRHYVEADTAANMADAVLALLSDTGRRRSLAARARALVENGMASRAVAQAFERACLDALARYGERDSALAHTA